MNSSSPDGDRLRGLAGFVAEATERLGSWPVAVRDEDAVVVRRSTMNTMLDAGPGALEPGSYTLDMLLPQGATLARRVSVAENGRIDAGSLADAIDAARGAFGHPPAGPLLPPPPAHGLDWLQPMGGSPAAAADEVGFKVRGYAGLPLAAPGPVPLGRDGLRVHGGAVRPFVGFADPAATGVLQVLREGWPTVNIVLAPGVAVAFSARRTVEAGGAEAELVAAPRFGSPMVDEIAHLRAAGRLAEVNSIVSAMSLDAASRSAGSSAGAALILAYALMRACVPGKAAAFAAGLRKEMPASPDAAVLVAEAASLEGGERHRDALGTFLEARSLGVPASSHGLTYLIERLRFYARCDREAAADLGIGSREIEAAGAALRDVQPFGLACDFTSPATSYRGESPGAPGAVVLDRDAFERAPGLSLTLKESE